MLNLLLLPIGQIYRLNDFTIPLHMDFYDTRFYMSSMLKRIFEKIFSSSK